MLLRFFMKRKILSLLLAFSVLLSLCGCAFSDDGVKVKVTFVCEDASQSVLVPLGGVASPPKTPRVEGKLFCGWYTDTTYTVPWDFSGMLTGDTTLYAKMEKRECR